MSYGEFIDVEPTQADLAYLYQQDDPSNGDHAATPRVSFSIVPLTQFVATVEELAEPLVGDEDEAMLPASGNFLMYGDGGAGKTTLTIDAVAHLASGTPWLGMHVARPLRIIVIENEGPRQPFRNTLERKMEAWQGKPFADNVAVLEEPWMAFTFDSEDIRELLAAAISEHQADIVVVGPLISIGAAGTGTPDEVNEFDLLVRDLRNRCDRNFALWIVHHENKAGDISGAWGRWPDTLVHVVPLGNGRSRITWDKARWASTLHKTSTDLIWAEGKGFELATPSRDRNLVTEAAAWLEENGNPWCTVKELREAIKCTESALKTALASSTPDVFEHQQGPPGRSPAAQCWRLNTAPTQVQPSLDCTPLHPVAPDPALDSEVEVQPVHPHLKDAPEVAHTPTSPTTATATGCRAPNEEDEMERLLEKYGDQLKEGT